MAKTNRRAFLVTGTAGLAAVATGAYFERHKLAGKLEGMSFRALEDSTPLRRKLWPIGSKPSGWTKYAGNPVLGGQLGTCFDAAVLPGSTGYEMWFSWRPHKAIGYTRSLDGIAWNDIHIVLPPGPAGSWKAEVNRPTVVKVNNRYQMWFTGQSHQASSIGMAESEDGQTWRYVQEEPVFAPTEPWETTAVMCPNVLYEEGKGYKMWYSAGGQFEPLAIGYAESEDGIRWNRRSQPIFTADSKSFDCARVAGASVVRSDGYYVLFYIGFRNIEESGVCLARSVNGIDGWERHPANPIILPGASKTDWDYDSVYRPAVLKETSRWVLWFNGRHGGPEQIGLAVHQGLDLGFPPTARS